MRGDVLEQSIPGSTLVFPTCNGGEEVRSWQKSSLGLNPRGVSSRIDEGKQASTMAALSFPWKYFFLHHNFDVSRSKVKRIASRFLTMQTISESKLKSFSIGMMNVGLKKPAKSKQDVEEKKKVPEKCLLCRCFFHNLVKWFKLICVHELSMSRLRIW